MLVDGTTYKDETPREVIDILERARKERKRICIRYGDTATGRDWGDPPMCGTIGRSSGPMKIPLLIKTRRSTGGEGLLEHRIIRITESPGKRVLYSHPNYHTSESEAPHHVSKPTDTRMGHATRKKTSAQLEREIAEALAKKPGGGGPHVLKILHDKTFAGQRSIAANVVQEPGEAPSRIEFVGPSRSSSGVGPVVMILRGNQQFVSDPSRFGTFGPDWVRRFFESA